MVWLRSAVFNLWFYGLTTVMLIGSPVLRGASHGTVLAYARLWARLVLGGLRRICGITWQITGTEHLPQNGPLLIASMHQSAFDTLLWVLLLPRVTYVLKQELTRIPLFGTLLRRSGMIAIDRSAGSAAIRDMMRAADHAVAQQRQIVIFPEGTRVAPGVQAKLHSGVAALAARTKLAVIPVVTDSGLRWGRRAFRKVPGVIRIEIQPPLPASLPRGALMAELAVRFAAAAASLREPVDNSVGKAANRLPVQSS